MPEVGRRRRSESPASVAGGEEIAGDGEYQFVAAHLFNVRRRFYLLRRSRETPKFGTRSPHPTRCLPGSSYSSSFACLASSDPITSNPSFSSPPIAPDCEEE
ncbi:hypothetical protein TIFTF001_014645 [Ficus carica]|uniref:Uncharacterized protein n=1 Tax=Ficus carica TaxID=3494 RepID=A0AA87ZX77_FICCA|nr:hypothetical protein TIFTF001_014645 [Ficus carica]